VITVGSGGMLSVAGGKWTTFRRIGGAVLQRVGEQLGVPAEPPFHRRPIPLPGEARPEAVGRVLHAALPGLADDVAEHLATHYGTQAHEVIALTAADATMAERVHPDGPDIWAQVVHAIDRDWACEVVDVLRRRTTVAVRGLDTPQVRRRVAELLATRGPSPAVA
jgi:glycerol-3-phosphate dehydrogenase